MEVFISADNGWGSAFTQNSVAQLRQMLNDDPYILGESVTELSPPAGFASTGSSVHEAMLEAWYMLLVLFILADWWSTMF